jgi:hypothetical protein
MRRKNRIIERRYKIVKQPLEERWALLPVEVRAVSLLLDKIGDAVEAAMTLSSCIKARSHIGLSIHDDFVKEMNRLRNGNKTWDNHPELEFAVVLHRVYQSGRHLQTLKHQKPVIRRSRDASSNICLDDNVDSNGPSPFTDGAEPTREVATLPLISDSETGENEEDEAESIQEANAPRTMAHLRFWSLLLEHLELCVTSRLLATKGRKKKFSVHSFREPALPSLDIAKVASRMEAFFSNLHVGLDHGASKHTLSKDCRVHVVQSKNGYYWIQFRLGLLLDPGHGLRMTNEAKKKVIPVATAVVQPESSLFALSLCGSKVNARIMDCIFATLERVVTGNAMNGFISKGSFRESHVGCAWNIFVYLPPFVVAISIALKSSSPLETLSGPDPYNLLKMAESLDSKLAVGRLLSCAAKGSSSSPMTQLRSAAKSNLLERQPSAGYLDTTEKAPEKKAMTSSCKRDTSTTNERTLKRSRITAQTSSEDVDFPVQTLLRMAQYGKTAAVTASPTSEPHSAHCSGLGNL